MRRRKYITEYLYLKKKLCYISESVKSMNTIFK